jgi:cell division protein FtsA
VLTDEETKQGALLIDFKTDMTEIAVITNGSLAFFESLPAGQEAITNEISSRLKVPYEVARELKVRYGFLLETGRQDPRNEETIPLEWMGAKQNIARGDLNRVIHDQSQAVFTAISEKLKNIKNFNNIIKRGAVITGGAAYMEGFLENAIQRFGFTARLGIIKRCAPRLGNEYATPAGLAFLAFKRRLANRTKPESNLFKKMYQKADAILTEYF